MTNILVTGSSKGFGLLIAKTLLKDGHRVIAGMRGVDCKNKGAAADLKAADHRGSRKASLALKGAFEAAARQLENHARITRGFVKTHAGP